MKMINAFIHHVRTGVVVEALADRGYRNLCLHEVKGMLPPITENERDFTAETGGLVIAEVHLMLYVNDHDVDAVTEIIRKEGRVGSGIAGFVYVSPVDRAIPIDGDGG